ncbi:DUF742 domain-containing protein [Streptomyces sp. NPDC088387]|uniref:DUF742 domain-containing protein n=1 Tax=Streptomyces sp. NPDC088387 TaxID=3365859 RepID=UPI00382272B6
MNRSVRQEDPDRLYTLTGGRSRAGRDDLDLVALVVSECDPVPGMQSEHAAILRMCQLPTAVVEIAADLRLPVGITKILLSDMLDAGRITVRPPRLTMTPARLPDHATLEKVLVGLRDL